MAAERPGRTATREGRGPEEMNLSPFQWPLNGPGALRRDECGVDLHRLIEEFQWPLNGPGALRRRGWKRMARSLVTFQWPLNGPGALRRVVGAGPTGEETEVSMAAERPGRTATRLPGGGLVRHARRFNGR